MISTTHTSSYLWGCQNPGSQSVNNLFKCYGGSPFWTFTIIHCEPVGKAQLIPIFILIIIPKGRLNRGIPFFVFDKSRLVNYIDLIRIHISYINLDTIIIDYYVLHLHINHSSIHILIDELAGILSSSCHGRQLGFSERAFRFDLLANKIQETCDFWQINLLQIFCLDECFENAKKCDVFFSQRKIIAWCYGYFETFNNRHLFQISMIIPNVAVPNLTKSGLQKPYSSCPQQRKRWLHVWGRLFF